jgi:hypothetical protein
MEFTNPTQIEKMKLILGDMEHAMAPLTFAEGAHLLGWIQGRLMASTDNPAARNELAAAHARSIEMARNAGPGTPHVRTAA